LKRTDRASTNTTGIASILSRETVPHWF
jgi:hypothetical protein